MRSLNTSITLISYAASKSSGIVLGVIAAVIAYLAFRVIGNGDFLPTYIISCVALVFSHQALRFSFEKFRLDLFERRLDVYESIVKLCSLVVDGRLEDDDPEKLKLVEKEASGCIYGLGFHRSRLLFGKDIRLKINELHATYVTLQMQIRMRKTSSDLHNPKAEWDAFNFFLHTNDQLPTLFRSYIYFGDYRHQ
jgi:hypothetical protein